MPRFSTVPPSGCPPIRIITVDELGYVKVTESRGQQPQVVARWGEGGAGRGVERMQVTSSNPFGGLVTVARSNQIIDLLDISSGQLRASWSQKTPQSKDPIKGIHLFQRPVEDAAQILTCSSGGSASLQKVSLGTEGTSEGKAEAVAEWNVGAGVESCAIDAEEQKFAVGGKGLDATLWNLETKAKLWQAKNTRPDTLGLQTPIWVTQLLFLGGDENKLLAGTGHHQLRLYDIKAQRRPVMVIEFGELPIWSVAQGSGDTVFAGNGSGELASFDLRTGTKSGGFVGSISGSVRSIALDPSKSLLASVGLDRFLRVHSTQTRKLLAKVFLKQQMVACAFDTDPSRQPEEAEPPGEEDEEPADNANRSMRGEHESEASDSGEGNSEDDEQAAARSRTRKAEKTRSKNNEESDSEVEADESNLRQINKERRKTGASASNRKRKQDEDSEDEEGDWDEFGSDIEEGSSEEDAAPPRKEKKSKQKARPEGKVRLEDTRKKGGKRGRPKVDKGKASGFKKKKRG